MPRGGKREGAGRPAPHGERKRGRNVALTAAVWSYLEAGDKSANEQIEAAIRRTPGFKAPQGRLRNWLLNVSGCLVASPRLIASEPVNWLCVIGLLSVLLGAVV